MLPWSGWSGCVARTVCSSCIRKGTRRRGKSTTYRQEQAGRSRQLDQQRGAVAWGVDQLQVGEEKVGEDRVGEDKTGTQGGAIPVRCVNREDLAR